MKAKFVDAIHFKSKVRLTFFSKENKSMLVRICAPMDYGPSRRAVANKSDRFHFWDYESDAKNHTLSLLPSQIESIEVLGENFDPTDFVTWSPNWFVARDWGAYS